MARRLRRAIFALAIGAVLGALSETARAQTRVDSGGRLFDVTRAERRAGLGAALLSARRSGTNSYRSGLEFRWVDELTWSRSVFAIHSGLGTNLRLLDDGYALSLGQSGGLTGVRLGAFELAAGTSVSALNVEWVDGRFGFGMLWPRSSAGLCLHLGRLRLDALAHVEYLWNWFGPDHFVRGAGLLISLEQIRLTPSFR